MAVVQIYPDPPILRFKDNLKLKRIQSRNENCWEQCITEEFPVDSEVIVSDGKVVCNIGPPHPGCLMEATLNHNVFVGKAVIRDPNNLTLAEFRYSGGVANGKCTLYYPSGEVYFQGELVNGYRSGFGREYDKRGNEVYAGFFKHGVRDEHIIKIDDMKDFWVETNNRGEVISICHKNGKGENEGPCIFYENGKVTEIAEYLDGDKLYPVYEFNNNNNTMKYYKKGVLRYYGHYHRVSTWKFVRDGYGISYESDGQTIRYNGSFRRNRYDDYGELFVNGRRLCGVVWVDGIPLCLGVISAIICPSLVIVSSVILVSNQGIVVNIICVVCIIGVIAYICDLFSRRYCLS